MAMHSTMLPLGTLAPNFKLLDVVSGQYLSLDQLKSPYATVIMFICNHCPYVKHIQTQLVAMAQTYQAKGCSFIAISANDAERYPEDGPAQMRLVAQQFNYPFPYLYDESQTVAKAYQAACTPDFYIFDQHLYCVYRGQFDDARPGKDLPITGKDLRLALDNLLLGKPIANEQQPSMGCSIKWKE